MLLLLSLFACAEDPRVDDILALTPDIDNGEALYGGNCTGCHGEDATGGSGPDLVEHLSHHPDSDYVAVILDGGLGMPAYDAWPDQDVADVVGYLRSLE